MAGTAHSIFPQIRGLFRTPLVVHWALFMISPTYFAPSGTRFRMGLFVPYAPSVCRRVKKLKGERVGRLLYAEAAFWKLLPARTEANTYANRSDTDAYARAIATTVVPGAAHGGAITPRRKLLVLCGACRFTLAGLSFSNG